MRDYQRQRVYDSELRRGRQFASVGEMQDYVDDMLRLRWWREHVRRPLSVMVHDGRGRRKACGYRDLNGVGHVKMPKWSRCEAVLLHEIAHTVGGTLGGGWHGPYWTGIFLGLLDRQLGRQHALRQMEAFREAGVDWNLPEWWKR